MKNFCFKFFALMCLMCVLEAGAYDFEVDGIYYNYNGNEATVKSNGDNCYSGDIVIPETVTYNGVTYPVTTLGEWAFAHSIGLTSVVIPNSIKRTEQGVFYDCWRLQSVIIGESVENLAGTMFRDCDNLTEIVIPNSVTEIEGSAFSSCDNLRNVIIGSGVNEIYPMAFWNCDLNTITCLATTPPEIGAESAFNSAWNATLHVPHSAIEAYRNDPMWRKFKNITSIYDFEVDGICYKDMGNGTVVVSHKDSYYNTYYGSVIIPDTVTYNGISYSVTGIGDNAFINCKNLNSLTIPVTISSIGEGAFNGCSIQSLFIVGNGDWMAGGLNLNVDELYIDSGVTSIIGMKVSASVIYSYATAPPTCDENTFLNYDGELHVPPTSLVAYFTAPYWSNFINIIGDAEYIATESIELSHSSLLLEVGEQLKLMAQVSPENATYQNLTWVSSNENVATVQEGTISAVSIGECDIIVSSQTVWATCHVRVVGEKVIISLDQHEATVLPNHLIVLNPIITPANANVVVASSDPTVAVARMANNKVQVVGIKEGKTTITVNSADGYALPDSCVVTVYTERGDVNCDGFINIADVTMLIDFVLTNDVSEIKESNADVDNNNRIGISDVTSLIDLLLETPTSIRYEAVEFDGITYKISY